MERKLFYLFIIGIACLLLLPACEEEEFSTNPEHTLTFSNDTLRMDTVITEIATSTYTLKVYNQHKQPLLISSITLANGASGFRINVDGQKGKHFTDIEIQGKDSLYIFVEATFRPQDSDEPLLQKDSIVFVTNGTRQDIKLIAYGQDGLTLRQKEITQDTLFNSRRPIIIYDSLTVKEGARLTLAAGTRLYFHGKAGLKVHGQLVAEGTLSAPVTLRGDRTDRLFPYLPYDRLPGQWGGVRIYTSSYENQLTYVDIHGASYGIRCDSSAIDRKKLTMLHSVIHQVSGDALSLTACQATVANSELSNAGGSCVNLVGGDYEFTHCTLANYFNWSMRKGVALTIKNEQYKTLYPITMAAFRNCLIAGSSNDEISGESSDDDAIPFNYYFSHSLINSVEEINDKIINVIWKKDDFFQLMDKQEQRYDFRLDKSSKAINIGKPEDAQNYPLDRWGMPRLSDEAPDAGCYEWQAEEEEDE